MPPQQNDPYQAPQEPVTPPPSTGDEHPFIEPQLGDSGDPSFKRRVFLWYATRIGAVLLVLGLLVGGGVAIYNAMNQGGEAPQAQDESQELYEGDGSDISDTMLPNSEWICPSGYSNDIDDETRCVADKAATVALTKSYSCKSGYLKSGSGDSTTCRKTVGGTTKTASASKSYSCPSGYTRSGSTCSRTVTKSATTTYTCPSGYTRSGTKCTKTTTTYKTPIATCKEGYVKSGSGTKATCTHTIKPNKNGTCKKGYTKKNGKCVRTEVPVFSCPSGYAKSGSGRNTTCSKITVSTVNATVKKTCPSGYSLSGSTCKKTEKKSASVKYTCPSGYWLSGSTCYQTIGGTTTTVKPTVKTSCKSGYVKTADGKQCEKTERDTKDAELVQTCEENWELLKDDINGSQCVLVDENKTGGSSDSGTEG